MALDRDSFILGMITAFCECVAGGCKRLALSPPMTRADFASVGERAERLIEAHGLLHYHERNADMPGPESFEWLLIAARQTTIDEYLRLRAAGCRPAESLEPFCALLSYDPARGVPTRYDAFRELFP